MSVTHTKDITCVITDECTAKIPAACFCRQMAADVYKDAYRKKFGLGWEFFVWVEGMQGPTPQAWGRDYQTETMATTPRPKNHVLAKHKLGPDDQWLNLDQLAKKYPYGQL
jgi:hypothetical protein